MAEAVEPVFLDVPGWRRLYFDLPGTGGSPAGEPLSDVVLDEVVGAIRAELDDQRFGIVGWSYGGYLAAGLTRRLVRQVSGLMMVCTGFKIRPEDRDLAGVLASASEPGWLVDAPHSLHEHLAHAVGCQTADVARRITAALSRNGPTDEAYLASLRSDGFALSDEDEPTLCEAPVCLLAGRRDRVVGYVNLFNALGSYDHATYAVIGDAGHYLPLEQPVVFATAIQSWLGQCQTLLDADSN